MTAATSREGVRMPDNQPTTDHTIVKLQLWLGFWLVVLGGAGAIVFGVLLSDRDIEGVALAIGTAVIGVGAALLPPGAAGSASARILSPLPNRDAAAQHADVVTPSPPPTLAGAAVQFSGTVNPNG